MPKVSVIVPSYRVGGIDVLVGGLKEQTFTDFDLVFVDCIYPYREGIFEKFGKDLPFKVLHLPPEKNTFPTTCFQSCINTALAKSDAEIVLITCDYVFFDRRCLQRHVEMHQKQWHAVVGAYAHMSLPPLKPSFPSRKHAPQGNVDDIERRRLLLNAIAADYVFDLHQGKHADHLWSVFNENVTPEVIGTLDITQTASYLKLGRGPTIPGVSNLKNDSFRLADLVAVNGLDEEFDGAHYCQDFEIAERLAKFGAKFFLAPEAVAFILDMHEHLTVRRSGYGDKRNFDLYERKLAAGLPVVANPGFSLAKMKGM